MRAPVLRGGGLPALLLVMQAMAGCVVAPATSDPPAGRPASIELESTPFHPQTSYQCGPAALATVLGAAGLTVSPAALADEVYLPGRQGSLQPELAAAGFPGRLDPVRLRRVECLVDRFGLDAAIAQT